MRRGSPVLHPDVVQKHKVMRKWHWPTPLTVRPIN